MNIAQIIKDKNVLAPPLKRMTLLDTTLEEFMQGVRAIGESRIPGFAIDSENSFLYTNLARWLMGIPMQCHDAAGNVVQGSPRKGIYIAGTTGTGKSLAIEIMRQLASMLNVPLVLNGEKKPLAWKSYLCTEICDAYATKGELFQYVTEDVICIQDLGAEIEKKGDAVNAETLYMGNRRNVMRSILEARGDYFDKMTIITSNYKIDGNVIQKAYGERVMSRLGQMCNYFILKGNDRRK